MFGVCFLSLSLPRFLCLSLQLYMSKFIWPIFLLDVLENLLESTMHRHVLNVGTVARRHFPSTFSEHALIATVMKICSLSCFFSLAKLLRTSFLFCCCYYCCCCYYYGCYCYYLYSHSSRKVHDLWWAGLPPGIRGKVWRKAIGNDLNISSALYLINLKRCKERLASARERTGRWWSILPPQKVWLRNSLVTCGVSKWLERASFAFQ